MTAKFPRRGARPLADLAAALLDPLLVRKAGMTTGLIAAWPAIAGQRLEGVSRPEKLVWPPKRGEADRRLEPATLVVACEGASVLRLQHQSAELLGRVNAFFGYPAVARLKIVQRAVAGPGPGRKPALRALKPSEVEGIRALTAGIDDPKLRAALDAFGESVLQRRPATPPMTKP